MEIKGLEHTGYYLFNPIWVEVSQLSQKLTVRIEVNGILNFFDLYPYNGKLTFDIAELIKGVIPDVKNKTSLTGQVDGGYYATINFAEGLGYLTLKKMFILGGKNSYSSNVPIKSNLNLTPFFWQGFPFWSSTANGITISNQNYIPISNKYRLTPRVNCDNIFIAFRNDLGGFSFYLFEDFNIQNSNKDKGYYITPIEPKTMGIENTLQVSVRSKIKREFYETIEHLSRSIEIYIYNKDKIIDSDLDWIRVVGSNETNFNPKLISSDVEFTFDVVKNFNKLW